SSRLPRHPHSFPTRRSSDLSGGRGDCRPLRLLAPCAPLVARGVLDDPLPLCDAVSVSLGAAAHAPRMRGGDLRARRPRPLRRGAIGRAPACTPPTAPTPSPP